MSMMRRRLQRSVDSSVTIYVHALAQAERQALQRRFDSAAFLALVFFVVPAVVALIWAWGQDAWWRWPVVAFTAVWALVWGGVGTSQLWAAKEDPQEDATT